MSKDLNKWSNKIIWLSEDVCQFDYELEDKIYKIEVNIERQDDKVINNYTLKFEDKTLQNIKDIGQILEDYDNTFNRLILSNTYIIREGKLIIKEKLTKNHPINKVKLDNNSFPKFQTLDIETYVENNRHIPYAIALYDGNRKKSFYLSDYNDSNEMISKAIEYLLRPKLSGYKVYIHNLSQFDVNFLLPVLLKYGEINQKMRASTFIEINQK